MNNSVCVLTKEGPVNDFMGIKRNCKQGGHLFGFHVRKLFGENIFALCAANAVPVPRRQVSHLYAATANTPKVLTQVADVAEKQRRLLCCINHAACKTLQTIFAHLGCVLAQFFRKALNGLRMHNPYGGTVCHKTPENTTSIGTKNSSTGAATQVHMWRGSLTLMELPSTCATARAAMAMTASLPFTEAAASATPGMARSANLPLATRAKAWSCAHVEAIEFLREGTVPQDQNQCSIKQLSNAPEVE
jgi:hypothetical protein